ncbi:MAG: CoA-binding protein [Proteobacteria bacterium]|nr:CoA-binding protein [Pseudomonadota bacterium]
MGPHYLNHFFAPKSVAIVGASKREESVGNRLLLNMLEAEFQGRLYPVNPKHEEILEIKTYPNIDSIPDVLELVVIATPAPTIPSIVRECGEKNVDSIIIITAGFAELGDIGKRFQQEVLDIAHRYNIRIIGPNCLGVIRPSEHLNATFGYGVIPTGHLALVSQSGAVCTAPD